MIGLVLGLNGDGWLVFGVFAGFAATILRLRREAAQILDGLQSKEGQAPEFVEATD